MKVKKDAKRVASTVVNCSFRVKMKTSIVILWDKVEQCERY